MLAKLTSKNQLTLPKSVTDRLGPVQYFEVQLQAGQVLLTPVRIQRGDAVRAKLAELDLDDQALNAALGREPAPKKVAVRKTTRATPTAKAAKTTKTTQVAKVPADKVVKVAPSATHATKTAAKPKAAKSVKAKATSEAITAAKPVARTRRAA